MNLISSYYTQYIIIIIIEIKSLNLIRLLSNIKKFIIYNGSTNKVQKENTNKSK